MQGVDVTLGLPAEVLGGLSDGRYYRDGGIVRDAGNGRIVALLRDVDVKRSPLWAEVSRNDLPLMIQSVSLRGIERRLERIEARLAQVAEQLARQENWAKLLALHEAARALGPLRGRIVACHLDLQAGRTRALAEHRCALLEQFNTFCLLARGLAVDRALFRHHAVALHRYEQALLLSGICARDLTERLDGPDAAAMVEQDLLAISNEICAGVERTIAAPSSLFWLEAEHRATGRALDESRRRLAGHAEARALLSGQTEVLAEAQLDG